MPTADCCKCNADVSWDSAEVEPDCPPQLGNFILKLSGTTTGRHARKSNETQPLEPHLVMCEPCYDAGPGA